MDDLVPETREHAFPPASAASAAPRMRASSVASTATPRWTFAEARGRLVEVCGGRSGAAASAAALLVRDAQAHGEPCAWVTSTAQHPFPPDLAAGGIDLEALLFVRARDADGVAAAELALRSGAFGLVVAELHGRAHVPMATLSRLMGLVRKHGAAFVFTSEKPAEHASLGSLVSLRADASRVRRADGAFELSIAVAKDKRRALPWTHAEVCRGPAGLR